MITVLNFKQFEKGYIRGFFDLRYHELTIKSCRLMNGNNGLWFSFPQIKGELDGEIKYFDQMYLTRQERENVRDLVLAELRDQGHIGPGDPAPSAPSKPKPRPGKAQFRGQENLDQYYSQPGDDIAF